MEILIGIVVILGLIILWGISVYNKLVRLKNMVEEAWSGIDVQLKLRANLIPNLLETVKGYMGHEKEILENVTQFRSQSMNAGNPAESGQAEGLLGMALGRLFAVAENYPDLKANENFLDLQNTLQDTENKIEMARRYYNGSVRNLNILIEQFPSNVIANQFQFQTAEFFELTNPDERAVPEISFK